MMRTFEMVITFVIGGVLLICSALGMTVIFETVRKWREVHKK